jgi:tRNA 2-thiouridine synthesizing protein A
MDFRQGSMTEKTTEKTLNLRGLKCPLPTLRVRKALKDLKSGDSLVAECTDPLTEIDIPHLINQTGDELVETTHADKVLTFRIRKR